MSDEPKTEKTAPSEGAAIDPKEVRTQLGLPETATDPEVIAGLLAVVASLADREPPSPSSTRPRRPTAGYI